MKQGFLQALAVAAYITLVGLFMWNANSIFGRMDSFLGPIFVLMLLSVSVMVLGLLVLLKPYRLFFAGKKKEAIDIVVATAVWLFGFLLLFLAGMLLFK